MRYDHLRWWVGVVRVCVTAPHAPHAPHCTLTNLLFNCKTSSKCVTHCMLVQISCYLITVGFAMVFIEKIWKGGGGVGVCHCTSCSSCSSSLNPQSSCSSCSSCTSVLNPSPSLSSAPHAPHAPQFSGFLVFK